MSDALRLTADALEGIESARVLRVWRRCEATREWHTAGHYPLGHTWRCVALVNGAHYLILQFGPSGRQTRLPIPISKEEATRMVEEHPELGGYPAQFARREP